MEYALERQLRQIDAQIHQQLTGITINHNIESVPETNRTIEIWRPLKPDGTRFPFEYWSYISEADAWEGINGLLFSEGSLVGAGTTPALAICRARFFSLFEAVNLEADHV